MSDGVVGKEDPRQLLVLAVDERLDDGYAYISIDAEVFMESLARTMRELGMHVDAEDCEAIVAVEIEDDIDEVAQRVKAMVPKLVYPPVVDA